MTPYSQDLRQRILETIHRLGLNPEELLDGDGASPRQRSKTRKER